MYLITVRRCFQQTIAACVITLTPLSRATEDAQKAAGPPITIQDRFAAKLRLHCRLRITLDLDTTRRVFFSRFETFIGKLLCKSNNFIFFYLAVGKGDGI